MTPERWARIEELYAAYLEQSEADRPDWLRSATVDDPSLADDLAQLLDEDTGGLHIGNLVPPATPVGSVRPGETIGPYRLVEPIGRGGMGEVWLARREVPFVQDVAVKIVRRGIDTQDVLERFDAERQILARLAHPNIARLLDGGALPDGRPYLVMEYVAGVPVDAYCEQRGLPLPVRLELFSRICDAVHAAHQALVVHRDLKPGNILVDDAGEVKLLDFGIAKVLEGDPDSGHTQHGDRRLTPDYASPEQLRGESLTTASDVYALGGLLYRLLAGRAPYRLEERTGPEAAAFLEAADWPPPSVASSTSLARALRGDLDNIVAKAMHADRDRRYASALALSEDLGRYLAQQPVSARPDTWRYRAHRFLARNRIGVGVAGAFVSVLIGFSVVTWGQSRRIEAQSDAVARERDASEAVVEYLVDLFRRTDPLQSPGDVTAAQILTRGGDRLADELEGQPLVQARVRVAMAQARRNLGDLEAAESDATLAWELVRDHPDPPPVDEVRAVRTLAVIQADRGRDETARVGLERAVDLARTELGASHALTAASLFSLAEFHRRDAPATADSLYREVLGIRRRILPPDSPAIATVLRARASVLRFQQRYDEAEEALLESLRIKHAAYGGEDLRLAADRNSLGALYTVTQRLEDAEENYAAAEALYLRHLGPEHPHVDTVRFNRSRVSYMRGDYDGAVSALRAVLAGRTARLGSGHPDVAKVEVQLGRALMGLEQYPEAAGHLRAAIASREASLGPGDWRTAYAQAMLGHCLTRSGDPGEGERLLAAALETIARERGAEHSVTRRIRELWEEARSAEG